MATSSKSVSNLSYFHTYDNNYDKDNKRLVNVGEPGDQ